MHDGVLGAWGPLGLGPRVALYEVAELLAAAAVALACHARVREPAASLAVSHGEEGPGRAWARSQLPGRGHLGAPCLEH